MEQTAAVETAPMSTLVKVKGFLIVVITIFLIKIPFTDELRRAKEARAANMTGSRGAAVAAEEGASSPKKGRLWGAFSRQCSDKQ